MKKVLVALAMVMGLGSSVAFAYVVSGTQSVEQTQQNPQDEFTKVEVKDWRLSFPRKKPVRFIRLC